MNISLGGVGCAAWDASILLAKWIYDHPEIFIGQRVHEVG